MDTIRLGEHDFVKSLYDGRNEVGGVTGRPPVKCINRVSGYWSKRVGSTSRIECAEEYRIGRDGNTSAMDTSS